MLFPVLGLSDEPKTDGSRGTNNEFCALGKTSPCPWGGGRKVLVPVQSALHLASLARRVTLTQLGSSSQELQRAAVEVHAFAIALPDLTPHACPKNRGCRTVPPAWHASVSV